MAHCPGDGLEDSMDWTLTIERRLSRWARGPAPTRRTHVLSAWRCLRSAWRRRSVRPLPEAIGWAGRAIVG
jgi:hypothetical protein